MSKDRQRARAAREAEADRNRTAAERANRSATGRRERSERRRLRWNQLRLWQHGSQFRRHRERWGAVGVIVLLVLLVVYLWTRSLTATVGTALICVIGAPVLAAFVVNDRNHR